MNNFFYLFIIICSIIPFLYTNFFCTDVSDNQDRIIITSKFANLHKIDTEQKLFELNYDDSVKIELPHNTTITTKHLAIKIEKDLLSALTKSTNNKENLLNSCKEISLEKDIHIISGSHEATAQKCIIDPLKQTCSLSGSVQFQQKKDSADDIAFTVTSNSLNINLTQKKALFCGNESTPVTTIIDITGHPLLAQLHKKTS